MDRKDLRDDQFAVPGKRKLPIPDAKHVKLAWDMVDATDDLSLEEKSDAKKRILQAAHEHNIDTSTWTGVSKSIYWDDESVYRNEFTVDVSKLNDDQHLVFGWANISVDKNGDIPLDWQGDITSPQVLEKAAYQYVLKSRSTGEMHQGDTVGYMVESVMFTKQKMAAMGIPEGVVPEGWWIGFYIPDDEVVAKVRSGEYKMFSIQGRARKLKV